MKIITITGYKGGVGKPTTAIHLAAFFSDISQTLLIDGDPNRTSVKWASRGSLPFKVVSEKESARFISGNNYLVIDTQARRDSGDLKELCNNCELSVLPLAPDILGLEAMFETAQDLESGQTSGNCLQSFRQFHRVRVR